MEKIIEKLVNAVVMALNSESGKEIMQKLLDEALKENPNLTNDEWKAIKTNFVEMVVYDVCKENPDLLKIEELEETEE